MSPSLATFGSWAAQFTTCHCHSALRKWRGEAERTNTYILNSWSRRPRELTCIYARPNSTLSVIHHDICAALWYVGPQSKVVLRLSIYHVSSRTSLCQNLPPSFPRIKKRQLLRHRRKCTQTIHSTMGMLCIRCSIVRPWTCLRAAFSMEPRYVS